MKELSSETINIDGVDYTLFLNRAGVVAWEKYSQEGLAKAKDIASKYKDVNIESEGQDYDNLPDDANPFEGIEEVNNANEDMEFVSDIFKRLYWIMLYTHHKLSKSDASDLYEKARLEYGDEQLVLLGQQMIEEVNKAPQSELKNLSALKPTKK